MALICLRHHFTVTGFLNYFQNAASKSNKKLVAPTTESSGSIKERDRFRYMLDRLLKDHTKMTKRGTWKNYNVVRKSPGNYLSWPNLHAVKKVSDEKEKDDLNIGTLAQLKPRFSVPASERFPNWRTLIEYLRWINKRSLQYENSATNDYHFYFRNIPIQNETSQEFDIRMQNDTPIGFKEKEVRKVRMI